MFNSNKKYLYHWALLVWLVDDDIVHNFITMLMSGRNDLIRSELSNPAPLEPENILNHRWSIVKISKHLNKPS
jgi:hypothetical protein